MVEKNLLLGLQNQQIQRSDVLVKQAKFVDPGYVGAALDRIFLLDKVIEDEDSFLDNIYEYKQQSISYEFKESKTGPYPKLLSQQNLLFIQKFEIEEYGQMYFKDFLEKPTYIVNCVSMVMGVYYFLWILLGSNFMVPYGNHMRTIS